MHVIQLLRLREANAIVVMLERDGMVRWVGMWIDAPNMSSLSTSLKKVYNTVSLVIRCAMRTMQITPTGAIAPFALGVTYYAGARQSEVAPPTVAKYDHTCHLSRADVQGGRRDISHP